AQPRSAARRVRGPEGAADSAVRNGRIGHDEMFAVVPVEFVRNLGKRFTLKRQQPRRPTELAIELLEAHAREVHAFGADGGHVTLDNSRRRDGRMTEREVEQPLLGFEHYAAAR